MEVHFYNGLISFLENESTVSDGSDLYEQMGVETPVDHCSTVFSPGAFLDGAFWEMDCVYRFST